MTIHPTGIQLRPDSARVLVRPFIPSEPARIVNIVGRALAMSESEAEEELAAVRAEFGHRHQELTAIWRRAFERVQAHVFTGRPLSETRRLLIGALFCGEYALESAALFNPSIVPSPDQSGMQDGELRFVLSLRATGEGHISSIEFRGGVIHADHSITLETPSGFVTAPVQNPNPTYRKSVFLHKLMEMGFENDWSTALLQSLQNDFTLSELETAMRQSAGGLGPLSREEQRTSECVRWLAQSNYEVHFDESVHVSERIIFPVSSNESNGMEDARFTRFIEDDGTATYYATYTAYNGRAILPQLLETSDFLSFRARTLNGRAVQNKGMALFPRRIHGRYAMISRQDDENLFLMYSDNPHFWSEPRLLRRPRYSWEAVKIGNCGSPLETDAGWLVITHGVGPMRKYSIGAILLDLEDPSKVLAETAEPLIRPDGSEREGYVPNVVYTCGALLHRGRLILPYGVSDTISTIVTIEIDELLATLKWLE
ncbi:glycosidase PH1107-related [Chthoniobacter flavus Ellin428]|uniref:Glycosidase PH1107-related n=1 Tax=Chthoniobacter flavus Ellin428 TaxID=497964 RepID=B4D7H0_9BACT|nr:glycoside hydrolase family 130 protein [Chthoniobacter flavus]EDY17587.1 glycosidase PH1107-related [Chthoniobacter flavus Ellin428]